MSGQAWWIVRETWNQERGVMLSLELSFSRLRSRYAPDFKMAILSSSNFIIYIVCVVSSYWINSWFSVLTREPPQKERGQIENINWSRWTTNRLQEEMRTVSIFNNSKVKEWFLTARRLLESKGSSSTPAIASIASFLPTLSLTKCNKQSPTTLR